MNPLKKQKQILDQQREADNLTALQASGSAPIGVAAGQQVGTGVNAAAKEQSSQNSTRMQLEARMAAKEKAAKLNMAEQLGRLAEEGCTQLHLVKHVPKSD